MGDEGWGYRLNVAQEARVLCKTSTADTIAVMKHMKYFRHMKRYRITK